MKVPRLVTWNLLFLVATVLVGLPSLAAAQAPADSTWPSYGNDPGGGRYSPLAQIDRSNVAQLRVAWTHRTGALQPETPLNKKAAFEAGPVADKAYGVSFFRLRNARVEEAVGARIFKLGDAPPTGR